MENKTTNEWSNCQGKPKVECPCINFVWKNPRRSVIYSEENLSQEFSSDYNEKSLVTILNSFSYTSNNGRGICYAYPMGPVCTLDSNCQQRPDGMTICNALWRPPVWGMPTLNIRYTLQYYEWTYKKCKLSPRRCVCKPHYKDHYCRSYFQYSQIINSSNFKAVAESMSKNKHNGKYQIGVHISLTHYPEYRSRDCHISSKYYGITMEDYAPPVDLPWANPISRLNCGYVTSPGIQPPRIRCRELNFHLFANGVRFEKGKPPAGTLPLIGPVRVPFM